MNPAHIVDENGYQLVCIHCGDGIDYDESEEAWYHVTVDTFTCEPHHENCATPRCMWIDCNKPGPVPLKEEVRSAEDDSIIEENYIAFLCQRHGKVAALMAAQQRVPFNLLDPLVIEEMPG